MLILSRRRQWRHEDSFLYVSHRMCLTAIWSPYDVFSVPPGMHALARAAAAKTSANTTKQS